MLLRLIITLFVFSPALVFSASKQVFHFNPADQTWQAESIENINNITTITTAGSVAWAVDYNTATVAFYDGKKWWPGTYLKNLKEIRSFFPGYPLSGKKPIAWIAGESNLGGEAYDFFDGHQWIEMASPNQYGCYDMAASHGVAWVACANGDDKGEDDVGTLIYKSDAHHVQWRNVPMSEIEKSKPVEIDSANDDQSYLFVKTYNKLFRVDEKDHVKLVLNELYSDDISGSLSVNKNVVTYSNVFKNNRIAISVDNGETWNFTPRINGWLDEIPVNPFILVTETGRLASYTGNYFTYNYKLQNPTWQKFTIPEISDFHHFLLDTEGAWIQINDEQPSIYRYNLATNEVADTHLKVPQGFSGYWPIQSLNGKQIITCGLDEHRNVAAYLYDGDSWHVTPLENKAAWCRLSDTDLPEYHGNNVWVYSQNS